MIPFVIKGFPSLFLPDPKGNPFRFKIWMFPKMVFLIIFTIKDRSNFSNLLFTLIHPLYSFPYWMGVFLGFGYLEIPIYISRPGSKAPFQLVVHVQLCGLVVLSKDLSLGQSELTATNALVGRSVHWMGCVFSFGAGWGSSQSISFCCWPLYFFFLFFFLFLAVFPRPDLTHSYPAHFPTFINIAPTYWQSYLNN